MKRAMSLTLAVVLLFTLTSATLAAPQQSGGILGNHVVRYGESLFCIARAYGVDPWAIARQNGIANANCLYVGTTLQIPNVPAYLPAGPVCTRQIGTTTPPPYTTCTCRSYHTVTYGETLSGIAVRYGVNMWTIANCNGIYNLNFIRAGSTLCIP
ncbi:MAG: LysM peptidoglycan-binding domain-containing protein [Anaerolineae bacterium]|jgi:lysozyme|nr:LysM peptidoglycan-binding domain-containing protein [Anaerolineae bacterium]